ncbi:MAG: conjugal transfer protein TraD [Rudaea sp.]|nr:conjugal transfer protein TraD [Rudaea sp.]
MADTTGDRIASQVARATERIGQLKARQLLREMRADARARARARRADARRRLMFGGVVLHAGFGDWDAAEVLGVLLDAREKIGGSPTLRLGMRKRGEQAGSQRSQDGPNNVHPNGTVL